MKHFRYNWPGNIRELKNFIERVVALSSTDPNYIDELMCEMKSDTLPTRCPNMLSEELMIHKFDEAEEIFRKEYIKYHMSQAADNISEVARSTHKSRMWVYRMNAKH